jgi:hypothetical protein
MAAESPRGRRHVVGGGAGFVAAVTPGSSDYLPLIRSCGSVPAGGEAVAERVHLQLVEQLARVVSGVPGEETDQDTGVAGQRDDQGEGTERAVPLECALQNLLIAAGLVGFAGVFDPGEPGGGDGLQPGIGVDGSGVESSPSGRGPSSAHPTATDCAPASSSVRIVLSLTPSAPRLAVGWPGWGRR